MVVAAFVIGGQQNAISACQFGLAAFGPCAAAFEPSYMKDALWGIDHSFIQLTKEIIMTTATAISYVLTNALLPRDVYHRRYRYWPSPRQLPSLEQPSIRNS